MFVLDFTDAPVPIIPGLYASLGPVRSHPLFKQNCYLRVARSDALVYENIEPSCLAWFRGNVASHPIRRRIVALKDPAFSVEHRDTGSTVEASYARDLQAGKFTLCPRGKGPSSYRVWEAMRLGRVPVIISDGWVDPPDVPWAEFAIRVAERDIEELPHILRAREADWPAMAAAARAAFETNFSLQTVIRWIDRAIREIALARQSFPRDPGFLRIGREALTRGLLPHWLREVARVRTGERTVYMAPQSEWVLSDLGRAAPHERF